MTWRIMDQESARRIRQFIVDAQASVSGQLFLTVQAGDASASDWIDVSGFPQLPVGLTQGFLDGRTFGDPAYSDFPLTLNNLTIVNDPSDYSV